MRKLGLLALALLAAACAPPRDTASTSSDAPVPGGGTRPDEPAVARLVVVSFSEGLTIRVEGSNFAITRKDGAKLSAEQASAAAALNQLVTSAQPIDVAPTHRAGSLGGEVPEEMQQSFDLALPPGVSKARAQQLAEDLAESSLVEDAYLASVGEAPGKPAQGAP